MAETEIDINPFMRESFLFYKVTADYDVSSNCCNSGMLIVSKFKLKFWFSGGRIVWQYPPPQHEPTNKGGSPLPLPATSASQVLIIWLLGWAITFWLRFMGQHLHVVNWGSVAIQNKPEKSLYNIDTFHHCPLLQIFPNFTIFHNITSMGTTEQSKR